MCNAKLIGGLKGKKYYFILAGLMHEKGLLYIMSITTTAARFVHFFTECPSPNYLFLTGKFIQTIWFSESLPNKKTRYEKYKLSF